jgi:hypothetical protein
MLIIQWMMVIYGLRYKIFFFFLIFHGSCVVFNKFYFLHYQKQIKNYNQRQTHYHTLKRKLFILSSYSKIRELKTEN